MVIYFFIWDRTKKVVQTVSCKNNTVRKKSPYSELFWKNSDQNNPEYGHFLRSEHTQI